MLDTNKVGFKISSMRKKIGISQEKLAEMLCISPQAISKWENGHTLPETSLLPVLSQIFGCTIDEIIMPAYSFDEKIEETKPNLLEQQAEHIAQYVVKKMEDRIKPKDTIGLGDDVISEAIINKHGDIGFFTINRGKESRSDGKICTGITVTSPQKEIKLLELIYHKRPDEFNGYSLLNGYVSELPQIYHIDYDKKLILLEDISDSYTKGYNYDETNETDDEKRTNYKSILRATADFHSTFWENEDAFKQIGLMCHFETKENMLAWISNAMERPYKKYRKDEEAGKIPKDGGECGKNNITKKQLDYYDEALQYLKKEYVNLIDSRFNAGKNITIIHGDLHPGQILMPKSADRQIKFTGLQAVRMGLPTEDLAMLIALHISSDNMNDDIFAKDKKDVLPLLDYYYQCLSEKIKDYSYEMFMKDYRLSITENLFFPIRLINRGIYDFRMRDKALLAFKTFVLESN
ncbi:MAG: helix-turn-helix domain-containing protein [Eubacteriales bacterium]|nr:helix-turn-helix domain-containing protein [Eubacteriales bacterium]